MSENSYANYERNSGYAASGNEEDLGGIKYDESTGTLVISGHGATHYRQYISYNDSYRYVDLTDTLFGIRVQPGSADREPTLQIRVEVDTRLSQNYGSPREPVSAMIFNPAGRIFLSSTTGATLEVTHTEYSQTYSVSPITGIYARDDVVISGNLNLDVSASCSSYEPHQPAYGIYTDGNVSILESANVEISAWARGLAYTSITPEDYTCAIRAGGTVGVNTSGSVALSASTQNFENESALVFSTNSSTLGFSLATDSSGKGKATEVRCRYCNGYFGLTQGGVGVASAPSMTGYTLKTIEDGVMYRGNNGRVITNTEVKIPAPQLGAATNAKNVTRTITPGIKVTSATYHYTYKAYSNGQTNDRVVSEQYPIPIEPIKVWVEYTVEPSSSYYSFTTELDDLGGMVNGKPATLVSTNKPDASHGGTDVAPTTATFKYEYDLSELMAPELVNLIDIRDVPTPVSGQKAWYVETAANRSLSKATLYNNEYYDWAMPSGAPRTGIQGGNTTRYREWWTVKGSSTALSTANNFIAGTTYVYHALVLTDKNHAFAGGPWGNTLWVGVNQSYTSQTYTTTTAYTFLNSSFTDKGTLVEVTREFRCPEPEIDRVEVTGLTEPVAGATAVADGKVDSNAVYTITSQRWYVDSNTVTGAFQPGTSYSYEVYLKPKSGYAFYLNDISNIMSMESIAAYINGTPREYCYYYSKQGGGDHPGEIVLRRSFFVPYTAEDTVMSIDLSTAAFGAGKTPGRSATSNTDGVSVKTIGSGLSDATQANYANIKNLTDFWYKGNWASARLTLALAQILDKPIAPATSFEADETYTFVAVVDLNGKHFAFDSTGSINKYITSITLNGIPAANTSPAPLQLVGSMGLHDTVAMVFFEYTVPTSGHYLYVSEGCEVKQGTTTLAPVATNRGVSCYEVTRNADIQLSKDTWVAPEGYEFWKWSCVTGNTDIDYPYSGTITIKSNKIPDADMTILRLTAPVGQAPRSIKANSGNYLAPAFSIGGWESNWGETVTGNYTLTRATYTGSELTCWPTTFVDIIGTPNDASDDHVMVEGVDYTLSYTNNVNRGTATVTITGIGKYENIYSRTYAIGAATINAVATFDLPYTDYSGTKPLQWTYYTGSQMHPSYTVATEGGTPLVKGVDYEESWSSSGSGDCTRVSDLHYVRITGKGNYYGSTFCYFGIRAHDIDEAELSGLADQVFSAGYLKPDFTLSFGDTTLAADTHYRAYYYDNYQTGTGHIRVVGQEAAGWTGERILDFTISPRALDDAAVTWSSLGRSHYTGDYIVPDSFPSMAYLDAGGGSAWLHFGDDFTVKECRDHLWPGTATVVLEGKGNFTGTDELPYEIYVDFSSDYVTWTGVESEYTWTGEQIAPEPTVSLSSNGHGSKQLDEGTHYEVSWGANVNVGTYSFVRIDPVDTKHYSGTRDIAFRILPANISDATVDPIPDQTYIGDYITPDPVIRLGDKTLAEGEDYYLEYANNYDVGEATIRIYGQVNLTGEKSVTFNIVEPGFESPFIDVTEATYHADDINWMYYSGVSRGWETPAGREYRPMEAVARCDMAEFLYRLAGEPAFEPTEGDMEKFSDVTASTPHARAIWWLASTGISTGYGDGTFRPYGRIVRCDMADFLHRMYEYGLV